MNCCETLKISCCIKTYFYYFSISFAVYVLLVIDIEQIDTSSVFLDGRNIFLIKIEDHYLVLLKMIVIHVFAV